MVRADQSAPRRSQTESVRHSLGRPLVAQERYSSFPLLLSAFDGRELDDHDAVITFDLTKNQ